jgi:hypothetical protein
MLAPIGEWMPDQPDYNNPGSSVVHNVFPKTERSYGPVADLTPTYMALNAKVQGAFACTDTSGNVSLFAGTATKLYRTIISGGSFTDISGTAYATNPEERWTFSVFGNKVLATNFSNAIQSFTLDSSTVAADLAAAAPKARYITVVKDFVMVGNTYDPVGGNQPQQIWWSAINDCTNWPVIGSLAAAQVQSDQQIIPGDQGQIMGLVGNLGTADVAIFFERAIWRGVYVGSPSIFSFHPAEGARGTPAPGSIAQLGSIVFYLGEDGFYMFDGSNSTPIGAQKIDKWFYADVNQTFLYNITSAIDPINKLVFWSYPGNGSATGTPDKLIIYNWAVNRWSICDVGCELIFRSMTLGQTLDGMDSLGYTLDTLPFSLDSRVWTGGSLILTGFDSNHRMGFFAGQTLSPTVETSEIEPAAAQDPTQLGRLAFIKSAKPIVDGGIPSVAIATRNRIMDSFTYNTPTVVNANGDCPQRSTGRFVRAQITLPAGSTFTHISGVDIAFNAAGTR